MNQILKPSINKSDFIECEYCKNTLYRKTIEWELYGTKRTITLDYERCKCKDAQKYWNEYDLKKLRIIEEEKKLELMQEFSRKVEKIIKNSKMSKRNLSYKFDNFEINNNSTILYNSNLVGKYIVINSSDNFNIDKDSEVRCDHTFFEIPEVPNCKLYPNSIKADRVSLNGALVNKDSNEFADITLIEPRNNLINLLKNLRNKYNEKMDFVSREINHEINGITVKEIETLKSDEEKILKRVKMNLNKNK